MAKEKKLDKEVVRDYATKNRVTFEQAKIMLEAEAKEAEKKAAASGDKTDGEE